MGSPRLDVLRLFYLYWFLIWRFFLKKIWFNFVCVVGSDFCVLCSCRDLITTPWWDCAGKNEGRRQNGEAKQIKGHKEEPWEGFFFGLFNTKDWRTKDTIQAHAWFQVATNCILWRAQQKKKKTVDGLVFVCLLLPWWGISISLYLRWSVH